MDPPARPFGHRRSRSATAVPLPVPDGSATGPVAGACSDREKAPQRQVAGPPWLISCRITRNAPQQTTVLALRHLFVAGPPSEPLDATRTIAQCPRSDQSSERSCAVEPPNLSSLVRDLGRWAIVRASSAPLSGDGACPRGRAGTPPRASAGRSVPARDRRPPAGMPAELGMDERRPRPTTDGTPLPSPRVTATAPRHGHPPATAALARDARHRPARHTCPCAIKACVQYLHACK
jgi:hypothetical protein